MKKVSTLEGQTMVDVAVQELGDLERLFEIALANDLPVSDELAAATVLAVDEPDRTKKAVVKMFANPSRKPASADTAGLVNERGEGIEFWGIENDFIIS